MKVRVKKCIFAVRSERYSLFHSKLNYKTPQDEANNNITTKKMGEIAARLSDAVIVTEDNSRAEPLTNIISDIMEGVKGNGKVFIVEERREAVEFAASLLSDGDLLVVAGKGAEKYIERNGRRVRYSDVDEAIALSRGER